MNIKNFLKPDSRKCIVYLIILILSMYFSGYNIPIFDYLLRAPWSALGLHLSGIIGLFIWWIIVCLMFYFYKDKNQIIDFYYKIKNLFNSKIIKIVIPLIIIVISSYPFIASLINESKWKADYLIKECDKKQGENIIKECYFDNAIKTRNSIICDKIQNEYSRDSCYTGVAAAKADTSICNKIKNEGRKNFCQGIVVEDY